MGTKYTTVGNSGYNASPPADDASAVESNKIKWSTIKEKLPDVLKTQIEAVEAALVVHVDESVVDKATAYTTTAADHKRTINVTALATQSLGDAGTMAVGYIVTIKNSHTAANTVDLVTGADTLDGTAAGSIILGVGSSATFEVNPSANGYLKLGDLKEPSKGADIASATALPFQSSAYADVTGTTTITSIGTSGIIGTVIKRQFDGALTLTHHATDLILPGAADITTAAGDEAEFVEYATGDWRCTNYQVASSGQIPAAVTGYTRAGNTQIKKVRVAQDAITSNVTENTWESYGATGSGADNIYAALDDVPASATILIMEFQISSVSGAGGSTTEFYVAHGDEATPATNYVRRVQVDAGPSGDDVEIPETVLIPIDSTSQLFQILWTNSISVTSIIQMRYLGFMTD